MKISLRWLLLVLVVLAVPFAQARQRVVGVNTGPAPKPKAVPFWTVDAVDQEGKSVTLTKSDGKDSQKYKVTASTKITINGQPDKFEGVQAGMKVENLSVSTGMLSALAVIKSSKTNADSKKAANAAK